MALRRTSVAMQNQILELHNQGRSIRKIAQALKIARNTVRACIRDSGPPSSVPSVEGSYRASLSQSTGNLSRPSSTKVSLLKFFTKNTPSKS
ncbi:MAG: helix-turn-helix domain-containing protein [Bdellovibrionales bacterium]|nr:helix-turn-helix domain-containing protein [Bdellovibrionales bacterium]